MFTIHNNVFPTAIQVKSIQGKSSQWSGWCVFSEGGSPSEYENSLKTIDNMCFYLTIYKKNVCPTTNQVKSSQVRSGQVNGVGGVLLVGMQHQRI